MKKVMAIIWLGMSFSLLPLARAEAPAVQQQSAEDSKSSSSTEAQGKTGDKKADGAAEPDCNN